MTPQPTAAPPGDHRTVPTEERHRHGRACFWNVDDCRWQCATYRLVDYALEPCIAIGRPIAHSDTGHGRE